jgi:hypothetical protein
MRPEFLKDWRFAGGKVPKVALAHAKLMDFRVERF